MNKTTCKIILACLFITCTVNGIGQRNDCGTKTPSKPLFVDSFMTAQMRTLYSSPLLMKVIVHVIAQTEGYAITRAVSDTAVMRQVENMRQFYAPQGICFLLLGIEPANNSDLRIHDVSEEADLAPYLVPDVLNIFVHEDLTDSTDALNGVAYGIPGYYLSVVASAIKSMDNRSTTAHEVGHCFGLYHTFARGFGEENIPRTGSCKNCETAGDLLCDTEADPHNDKTYDTGAEITAACNYTGTLRQLCGGVNRLYNMDPHNIMAYGRRPCRDIFTDGQGARARSIIVTNATLQDCIAPDNTTVISQTISSGRKIFASRNAIAVNVSNFTVNNTAKVNMASSTGVTFSPGVVLNPTGAEAYVSVLASLCQ